MDRGQLGEHFVRLYIAELGTAFLEDDNLRNRWGAPDILNNGFSIPVLQELSELAVPQVAVEEDGWFTKNKEFC